MHASDSVTISLIMKIYSLFNKVGRNGDQIRGRLKQGYKCSRSGSGIRPNYHTLDIKIDNGFCVSTVSKSQKLEEKYQQALKQYTQSKTM